MKLLLTSTGLANPTITAALRDLLGRPFDQCAAIHVPTAVHALPGGPEMAAAMAGYWAALGWRTLAALELTAIPSVPEETWLPDLEAADVILVAGGNSGYLSHWVQASGLAARLPGLLADKVYVGVSAGSCLLTPGFRYDPVRLAETGVYYDDEYDEAAPLGAGDSRGLGLVDFYLRPHLNSTDFGVDLGLAAMGRAAAQVDRPLYAIDDESAVVVDGDRVEVVSEGRWQRFEPGR